jgi:hypothetical protein
MASEVKVRSCKVKNVGRNAGRSISLANPTGKRRVSQGKELAPKSLRRKGKVFITDCTEEELTKLGLM